MHINKIIRTQHLREGAIELWQARNWPRLQLFLLWVLMSLGQLQRWQATPGIGVYGHDLLLVGWVVWLMCQPAKLSHFKRAVLDSWNSLSPLIQKLVFAIAALTLLRWLGAINQPKELAIAVLYASRLLLYAAGTWTMVMEAKLPWFVNRAGFMMTGLLMAWLGLCQYFLLPDTRFLSILGWDDHLNRLIGPVFDPNFMGILVVITGWYAWSVKQFFPAKVMQVWFMGLLVSLVLTVSRASYLAALVSVSIGVLSAKVSGRLRQKIWQRWAVSIGMTLALTALVGGLYPQSQSEGLRLTRTKSVMARVTASATWLQGLSATEWLVGKGFLLAPSNLNVGERVATADTANWPDTILVLTLSGWGVLGSGLVAILSWHSWQIIWRRDQSLALALLAVLIHSLFNHTLFQPFVWLMLWGGIASRTPVKA